jgi:hypothetical protein
MTLLPAKVVLANLPKQDGIELPFFNKPRVFGLPTLSRNKLRRKQTKSNKHRVLGLPLAFSSKTIEKIQSSHQTPYFRLQTDFSTEIDEKTHKKEDFST